jgi:hypothetical protein
MRYKTQIVDKLISVSNGLKQLRFLAERGEIKTYRETEIKVEEVIEEIQTLLNTNQETY